MSVMTGSGQSVWKSAPLTQEEFLRRLNPPAPLPQVRKRNMKSKPAKESAN